MTTEAASDDRAARLEALRQRRAGRTNEGVRAAVRVSLADRDAAPTPRTRRRHAAAGARLFAGSLSAATALGLVGVMAGGVDAGASAPLPEATQASPATPTVVIVRRIGNAQATGVGATPIAAAPRVTPAVAPAATSSRGS